MKFDSKKLDNYLFINLEQLNKKYCFIPHQLEYIDEFENHQSDSLILQFCRTSYGLYCMIETRRILLDKCHQGDIDAIRDCISGIYFYDYERPLNVWYKFLIYTNKKTIDYAMRVYKYCLMKKNIYYIEKILKDNVIKPLERDFIKDYEKKINNVVDPNNLVLRFEEIGNVCNNKYYTFEIDFLYIQSYLNTLTNLDTIGYVIFCNCIAIENTIKKNNNLYDVLTDEKYKNSIRKYRIVVMMRILRSFMISHENSFDAILDSFIMENLTSISDMIDKSGLVVYKEYDKRSYVSYNSCPNDLKFDYVRKVWKLLEMLPDHVIVFEGVKNSIEYEMICEELLMQ